MARERERPAPCVEEHEMIPQTLHLDEGMEERLPGCRGEREEIGDRHERTSEALPRALSIAAGLHGIPAEKS
jgi:hypothetical protein